MAKQSTKVFYYENDSFRYRIRNVRRSEFIVEIERHPWPKDKYYEEIGKFKTLEEAMSFLVK